MSRSSKSHRAVVLALLALVFLLPALATAQPQPREAMSAATTSHDTAFLDQLRSLLSTLWKTGSILEPNGRPGPNPPATTAGDTGSILEPDGRH
ncbi:MAG TPA: hypothetical protein VH988_00360 [Thermoanaerobaculia bacterium]|jgi:hypothetical protein|nr:hypothetical protein [Thermoanaerobaculia bacterium]